MRWIHIAERESERESVRESERESVRERVREIERVCVREIDREKGDRIGVMSIYKSHGVTLTLDNGDRSGNGSALNIGHGM